MQGQQLPMHYQRQASNLWSTSNKWHPHRWRSCQWRAWYPSSIANICGETVSASPASQPNDQHVGMLCLLKTLLESIIQPAKLCMGTICPFHLIPCLVHISPQQLHHRLIASVLGIKPSWATSMPSMGRCSRLDTSLSVIIFSLDGRWKLDVS